MENKTVTFIEKNQNKIRYLNAEIGEMQDQEGPHQDTTEKVYRVLRKWRIPLRMC